MISAKLLVLVLMAGVCTAVPFRRVVNSKQIETLDPRPMVAWIQKGTGRLHCGATFVSDNFVITAASCIKRQNLTGVIGGDYDLSLLEGTEQFRNIKDTIIHPDYNETTLENDIALLQLDYPVEYSEALKPMPFLTSNSKIIQGINLEDIYNKHCRIAGWGKPKPCLKGAVYANPLEEIVVDRVNDTYCDSIMSNRPSSTLCFHPFRRPDLSSTCIDDIGGPFICKIRTEWHLLGVISAWKTDEVCSPGFKGATKLPAYGDWILSKIGPLQTTTSAIIVDPVKQTTTPETILQTGTQATAVPVTATTMKITPAPTTAAAQTTTGESNAETTVVAEATLEPLTAVPIVLTGATSTASSAITTDTAVGTTGVVTNAATATTGTFTAAPTDAAASTTGAFTVVPTDAAASTTGAFTAVPTDTAAATTGAVTAAATDAAAATTGAVTAAPTDAATVTTGAVTAAPTDAATATTGTVTAAPTDAATATTGAVTAAPTDAATATTGAVTAAPTDAATATTGAFTAAPTNTAAATTGAVTAAPADAAAATTGPQTTSQETTTKTSPTTTIMLDIDVLI